MKKQFTCTVFALVSFLFLLGTAQAAPQNQEKNHSSQKRAVYQHRVGHRVANLPNGRTGIRVGRNNYYYHGGNFYRPRHSSYIVVAAPIGARVHSLPRGYVSFGIGSRHYSYVNATFFLWDRERSEYIVVEEPEGAAAAMTSAQPEEPTKLFVYPKQRQTQQQTDRDRYECYLWSATESNYDPTYTDQPLANLADYNRAMSACLEGRGYTVK